MLQNNMYCCHQCIFYTFDYETAQAICTANINRAKVDAALTACGKFMEKEY